MNSLALAILVLAGGSFLYRVLRGPTVPDRAVALDGYLAVVVAGIVVSAARADSDISLTTVLIVALAAFVGTIAIARFVERRGG